MARLYIGWKHVEEQRQEAEAEAAGAGREYRTQQANPHRQGPGPRQSDWEHAREFNQQLSN